MKKDSIDKNENIQMLRGLCCIFICLNHFLFFNKYSFGEIGVEFFVILSGFLTALNAAKYPHLRKYYFFSKIKKIIPLYWLATIFVYGLGLALPQLFSSLEFNVTTLLKSLFLIPGSTFIIFPGWTLTYFFVFYLIYQISDLLSKKRDFVASILVVLFVSVGWCADIFIKDNLVTKIANPILLEFVYGIILYHLTKKIYNKWNLDILGWIIIAVLFFNYNKYLGARWCLPSLLTCLVIICFYNSKTSNLFRVGLQKVGNISFVVYIMHPIMVRPIDKIVLKLSGGEFSLVYFGGIVIGVLLVLTVCFVLQPVLRKIHVV